MHLNQNPATYMLEILGVTDFHLFYKSSTLCENNAIHAEMLCSTIPELSNENKRNIKPVQIYSLTRKSKSSSNSTIFSTVYATSYWFQFRWLFRRVVITYWRTPSYNFTRFLIAILMAFIFSSAYPSQTYYNYSDVIARIGLIFSTILALGAVNLQTILPITYDDLIAYYREQQSTMYSPLIYSICQLLVEIPYVM